MRTANVGNHSYASFPHHSPESGNSPDDPPPLSPWRWRKNGILMRRAGSVESPLGGRVPFQGGFVAVGCYVGPGGFACDLKQSWRWNFRCNQNNTGNLVKRQMMGLVVRSCIILQRQCYSICFVDPGGAILATFWIELSDVYFHLSICWCIIRSQSSISTGVFFQSHKLSISQSPNKNSESFPRWRCASCDLLFALMETLGWKIQPCYIIMVGNLPTSTGERQASEPSRVQLRMGASVMEFNVLAEEVIRSKVSDLAGASKWGGFWWGGRCPDLEEKSH